MSNSQTASRDPVCGADVVPAEAHHSLVWRGQRYYFCGEQCRERFAEHPAFYTAAWRTADIRPIPKRRRLKFVAAADESLRLACGHLLRMHGVGSAVPGADGLIVEYDLRLACLKQVEAVVAGAGLVFKAGLHGLRRRLWRYAEHEELENAAPAGSGACCNRPPVHLKRG